MPTHAQSAEERKLVGDSVNAEALRLLSAQFQKEFERQEAIVLSYLRAHPDKSRSFEKNGSTYYLKRIGDDGSPVYITTKGTHRAGDEPSERPARLDPPGGGVSR